MLTHFVWTFLLYADPIVDPPVLSQTKYIHKEEIQYDCSVALKELFSNLLVYV